jgi:hypothetical protein
MVLKLHAVFRILYDDLFIHSFIQSIHDDLMSRAYIHLSVIPSRPPIFYILLVAPLLPIFYLWIHVVLLLYSYAPAIFSSASPYSFLISSIAFSFTIIFLPSSPLAIAGEAVRPNVGFSRIYFEWNLHFLSKINDDSIF